MDSGLSYRADRRSFACRPNHERPIRPVPNSRMDEGSGEGVGILLPNRRLSKPIRPAVPLKVTEVAVPEKDRPTGTHLQKSVPVPQPPMFVGANVILARTVPVPFAPLQTVTVAGLLTDV